MTGGSERPADELSIPSTNFDVKKSQADLIAQIQNLLSQCSSGVATTSNIISTHNRELENNGLTFLSKQKKEAETLKGQYETQKRQLLDICSTLQVCPQTPKQLQEIKAILDEKDLLLKSMDGRLSIGKSS